MSDAPPTTKSRTRTVVSVVVALLVAGGLLYVLLDFVGVADVLDALRSAPPSRLGLVYLAALAWMASWGYTLHVVFAALGTPSTLRASFARYLTVLFANNVAPFSVGGGEPIAALFVSRSTRTTYERSLLAVVSTDVLNYLPAPVLAALGFLYGVSATVLGRQIETLVGAVIGLVVVVVALGVVGWRNRRWLAARIVETFVVVQRVTIRLVPSLRLPSRELVQRRVETLSDALERVASDRRALRLGLLSSAVGWFCQAGVLWLSLYAVGITVPLVVPVFVVSLLTLVDVFPLPGGLGTADLSLVVLIVAVTGTPATTATAAALVFRSATLLFPILLGGVALVGTQFR